MRKILQNTHTRLEITENFTSSYNARHHKGEEIYITCRGEGAKSSCSLFSAFVGVLNKSQWGKKKNKNLSNWHPAEKSGIGTLSPSRAVARNLRVRRISSISGRSYSSMKLSLTILDPPWRGSFSLSTPLIPPLPISIIPQLRTEARREPRDPAKRSLSRGQRVRKRENSRVSASRSVAFDRSIANTLVYTRSRASIIFIAAVLSRVQILHFYRRAIFCPCLHLILWRCTIVF